MTRRDRWWNLGAMISAAIILALVFVPGSDRLRLHVGIVVLMYLMFDLGRRYGRWRVERRR